MSLESWSGCYEKMKSCSQFDDLRDMATRSKIAEVKKLQADGSDARIQGNA
jgi:hypothetical protein